MTFVSLVRHAPVAVLALCWMLATAARAGADDEILNWPGAEKDTHPRLYVTPADVAKAKTARADIAALAKMQDFNADADVDTLISAALLTDNAKAQSQVVQDAKVWLDRVLTSLPETFNKNTGPHAYAKPVGMALSLSDAALAMKSISPADRADILSRIAKISYQINRPDYWGFNPWRGSYNPNMWTSATGYRLGFAALIPSHPKAKEWFNKALAEHKTQIEDWIDPHGGNAEAPHYAIVSFNQWLGSFVIARNAGAPNDGFLFDPKLKLGAMNLANITTPTGVLPSLGHTYAHERTNTFGLMACLWKEKDPKFAAEMAWMHNRAGSFNAPGIKSYYPAFMGYMGFFTDLSGVQRKTPSWGSQYYPEVGVQLRSHFGDRETTLYMIAGRHHNHYFNDSGSITVWGKGAEFCHEDDYQNRRPPVSGPFQVGMYRESHSMPDKPSTYSEERVMDIREFSGSPDFDYTSGVRMGWTRQIAFVKDADPLKPNYFVLADTFDATAAPTIWRLYVTGACTPIDNGVTVTGVNNTVMDVLFLPLGVYKPQIKEKQEHIHVDIPAAGTLTAILFPRDKSEATPKVAMAADGKGIQITTAAGTDVVYLSPKPIKAELADGKRTRPFEGKACLVKKRGDQTVIVEPGACDAIPGWEGGDPQLRELRWKGPQFPPFPDSENDKK